MELVAKLLMNSLYGKFGQKFVERPNWVIADTIKYEDISKYDTFELIGDNTFASVKETCEPSSFCIPIWSAYVTAYARDKLYNYIVETDPYYCDTDSIMCEKEIPTSTKLGDMKLEMGIKNGFIVKPKMYALFDTEGAEYVKTKGVGKRLQMDEFKAVLKGEKVKYLKFTKLKEAVRRGMIPNEIIEMEKQLTLDDTKRNWVGELSQTEYEESTPIFLTMGKTHAEIEKYINEFGLYYIENSTQVIEGDK